MYAYISMYVYVYVYTHTHTQVNTMEYYSAIKKNKTGSCVEMCMDLKTVIQSEVRKTSITY